MKMEQFDERQLKIRGQVFFHGLLTALSLVLLNAFLQDEGIVWADPFHQNILIFMGTVTVVSIEAILRGAFFGRRTSKWMLISIYGVLAIVLCVFCFGDFLKGAALTANGGLTGSGSSLVFDVMFITTTMIGIIQSILERRKENE